MGPTPGRWPGAGHIDGGAVFNGSSSYVTIPPASYVGYPVTTGSTTSFLQTTEVWFKSAASGVILGQDDGTAEGGLPNGWVPGLYLDSNGKLRASLYYHSEASLQIVSPASYNDNNWHHAVDVYNDGTETLYVDGVAVGSQTVAEYAYSSRYQYFLGTGYTPGWSNAYWGWLYWNGVLDEVRVSNTARTAGWIETEYHNESSPSTFLTEGPQQSSGVAASITATAGTLQSATEGTAFATALQATVQSSGGTAVSGVTVTFTAPDSGASATFTGSPTATAITNGSGVATAPALTANGTAGSYAVTASVPGVAAAASFSLTNISSGSSGWYNSGWSNRKAVTINQSQVAGGTGLTNFPVLFSVTDPNLVTIGNGGGVGNANGGDILFTASDGLTKLNHEVELYNGATGQLIAWVQVPALSASANTVIYVYYGNAGVANQWNASGVWDSNYQGVWHLANGTSLSVADSTAKGNNGSNSGAVAGVGNIDGGAVFNGSSSYVTIPPASYVGYPTTGSTTSFLQTTEVWFKSAASGVILGQDDGTAEGGLPNGWVPGLYLDSNGKLRASLYYHGVASLQIVSPARYNDNNWHHAVDVYNNGTETLYVDGVAVGSQTVAEYAYSSTYQYFLGTGYTPGWSKGNSGWLYWNGVLDEVRVSNTARTAGWIETEYNNQSSPSTFLTEGPQQSGS